MQNQSFKEQLYRCVPLTTKFNDTGFIPQQRIASAPACCLRHKVASQRNVADAHQLGGNGQWRQMRAYKQSRCCSIRCHRLYRFMQGRRRWWWMIMIMTIMMILLDHVRSVHQTHVQIPTMRHPKKHLTWWLDENVDVLQQREKKKKKKLKLSKNIMLFLSSHTSIISATCDIIATDRVPRHRCLGILVD